MGPNRRAVVGAVVVTTSAALAVTGCTTASSSARVTAAPEAASTACATALAAAPATVADRARTPLPVEGALSWGEPAIILRCGLPAQAPTSEPCLSIDGVDWIINAEGDPFVFVSYGRTPAVELRVPASHGRDSAVAAATDLGPVAAALPANGRTCVGPGDVSGPVSGPVSGSVSAGPSGG